jgi:hypothetical protein
MISANPRYITEDDIEEVLKLNPNEDDLASSFVTDGKYLYYVDGYTNPQEIRALSDDEQFQNLPELAKGMKMTEEKLIAFMLKQNKDVDYQNIPENDFNSKKEVNEWWKDKDDKMIFKVYDEYMGIQEMIVDLIG